MLVDTNVREHSTVAPLGAADNSWRLTFPSAFRAVLITIALLIAALVGLGLVFGPAFFAVLATAGR